MKKIFPFMGICIMIFALVGLVYTASSPIVDTCAPPTKDGMTIAIPVCTRQESTNWAGISVSLAALVSGVILTAYSLRTQKKK